MTAGFLCLDKPPGVTSRDVVNAVQRFVRPLKVGHAGTLDPLATGVLVVAVGSATRLISYVQDGRKAYRGTFRLGQTSDTDDITGQLIDGGDPSAVTAAALADTLSQFVGSSEQTPPQFSAVHVQGQRAYDLARQGVAMDLAARTVEMFAICLVDFSPPEFTVDVECGSGTYIRALGRDVGLRLGCGAVMTALRRTAVGAFTVERAATVEGLTVGASPALESQPTQRLVTRTNWKDWLWPSAVAVEHLARCMLSADEETCVRRGQAVRVDRVDAPASGDVALFDAAGELVGIGELDMVAEQLRPRLVLPTSS